MMASLLDILIEDGRFNTFVSAIQASNLTDTFNQLGPLTVFAPTDDAFAGLPEGAVDTIMADIQGLTALVTYHIVPERLPAERMMARERLKTMQGDDLKVRRIEGVAYVNDAQITATDLEADNGLIHVVDAVILPPQALT
ncbi:MAG: fasciclin domain-containing protein [Chloroflexota bacterium]